MECLPQFLTNPKIINSIGLLFDIAGVILLFIYGLANDAGRDTWGGGNLEIQNKVKFRGRTGLTLLIIGFALQIISNWVGGE